jgi:hypothetical protein
MSHWQTANGSPLGLSKTPPNKSSQIVDTSAVEAAATRPVDDEAAGTTAKHNTAAEASTNKTRDSRISSPLSQ